MEPIIGFTGTQDGMTPLQRRAVRFILFNHWMYGAHQFHHGDCIGSDKEADDISKEIPGYETWLHPPTDPRKRAFCRAKITFPPRPYLERNRDIVENSNIIIATPKGPEELRSGTWSTIRYARKDPEIRKIYIIYPDGQIGIEKGGQ